MNKTRLRKYAHLIASTGANIQKGQEVIVAAGLDQPEFVKMLVEECYKLGAKKVSVDWSYQPLEKLAIRYQSSKVLGKLEDWQIEKWKHQAEFLPAKIYLTSEDPDGLKGVNQKKYAKARAERAITIKPIRRAMENRYQWCIAGVPGEAWAKKVFPGMRVSTAVEKLWEAILDTSRVDDDPIAAWDAHNKDLADRSAYLNSLELRKLVYKASNGTDLTVGLIPEALFCAGGETSTEGIYFNPNIPTEEVFTSPKKGEAEGIVYSSLPLSYGGELIENFWIRFEGGKAVESGAERNADLLNEMLTLDEGASYLGECALVPYSSPIRKSGVLFYNTLYDENAACHLAIGMGFTNVLRDFDKYTDDEAHKLGINDSVTHVDFMIGTADLSITGIDKDGKEIKIFENGEWAF
ncbi:MAG: aminopeptidase [Ruminococcaceae bacterium]|nr:aminopeptidase [Oscillospiraceae bacterium]